MGDWKYSEEYKEASLAERRLLDALSDILFEVQYAKLGSKTEARRTASLKIFNTIKAAYKVHTTSKL